MNVDQNGTDTSELDPFAWLAGGGEMGERTRAFDWSRTPLGPVAGWPQSLRIAVRIMLGSRYAMWLGWGPDFTFFYNDAYAQMTLGPKHPWALGRSAREVWSEIWDDIGPRARSVVQSGQATWDEGLLLFLERRGFPEETYHTFSYSPLPDDQGGIGGMLCVVTEDTERAISERRLKLLRELAARTAAEPRSPVEACQAAVRTLVDDPHDLPFVLIYLADDASGVHLAAATGLADDSPAAPTRIDLGRPGSARVPWPLDVVLGTGQPLVVTDLAERIGAVRCGVWPEQPHQAVVLPLAKPGHGPGLGRLGGFVVAGVSPRLELDDAYMGFLDLLAGHIATAVTNARAYEEERRRAEALAELDRAKTAFFSNVSHELRTPLTLMLGPVDDLLADPGAEIPSAVRLELAVVQRNGVRLLRLVNTLLDFARLEAGRARAVFRPTDLAAFTADLASLFRAAVERAGLELVVEVPELDQPVFVDRDMWEKIVLNLLSNALKFTFEGRIALRLRPLPGAIELTVTDTGIGIPPAEMPRLFERFHRIESARGRTHEGTGIGLALVQELVKLHGGTISALSTPGEGATFVVSVPLGASHLPADQVGTGDLRPPAPTGALPFVEEALRWFGNDESEELGLDPDGTDGVETSVPAEPGPPGAGADDDRRPRVLVADDNADMRRYIVRLLAARYRVEAVADGEAALLAVRAERPDLVLTDVMMPRLDGFSLLQQIRDDPRLRDLPVILLSARAGEESRVEGMEAGADDYLVKPFGARELIARVSAHVEIARLRREASESLRESESRLRMALGSARMVAWEVDPSAHRLSLSENAAEVFGVTPETPLDDFERGLALIHDDDRERLRQTAEDALAAGQSFVSQFRMRRPSDGAEIWLEAWGHVPGEHGGPGTRVVGVTMDITERKRAEDALRDGDRRKDEFLATLAHELRNPLAPLANALEVLRLAGSDAQALERTRAMMVRQLAHMVRIIDDLLDVSRISQGRIELRRERVELARVIQHAIETNRPLIEARAHTLVVELAPEPVVVDVDVTRLTQVIGNLLNNAAKYTERGGRIVLRAERRGGDAVVTVRDTGLGIPQPMLPRVFDMFTQVDRSLEKSEGGLGIGLSLVKALIELHGGSVEALSDGPGRGSEFVVRVPLARGASDEPRDAAADDSLAVTRRRILVADDNRDAAVSLAMLLELRGNETRTAHDGVDALAQATTFQPDLVLLDIGMPKLNGYDVCRRIRGEPWGQKPVLVALTGWGQAEDRRRAHDAGFDFHLVKPVDLDALDRVLAAASTRS